jgi:hypothetical protein
MLNALLHPSLQSLLEDLEYTKAPHWRTAPPADPVQAQNHRLALAAGAAGAYYVPASAPASNTAEPALSPVVYVAEAQTLEHARAIRKRLWNLGAAPFLIILLPDQVRAYASFIYAEDLTQGLLRKAPLSSPHQISNLLREYNRQSIDTGRIWEANRKALRLNQRVDEHLLRNLQILSKRLQDEFGIGATMAHALIGKFIYISYLHHRGILSDEWLRANDINKEKAWGREASAQHLRALIERLESRFGGRVFPLTEQLPADEAIRFLARIFAGEEAETGQLGLDFGIYDFSYIPIELLSSVYEHFLRETNSYRKAGAVYTPEYFADFLLTQAGIVQPIEVGQRILDPCCGSGVFLVLALRRLIELQMANQACRPSPDELASLLTDSIFGVERNLDACYVAEFSLLLTLFSYLEPPDLQKYPRFRFPDLHNRNIFRSDFFDSSLTIQGMRFDLVIGNPPWIDSSSGDDQEPLIAWVAANRLEKPTPRRRTSEAFVWRSADFLRPGGVAALVLPATTLFNAQLGNFRRAFFSRYAVHRVANLANLAYVLFAGRADAPAFTLIFSNDYPDADHSILHFGPFVAHHPMLRAQRSRRRAWTVTINDREVSTVSQLEARAGASVPWKLALWGSTRDARNLAKLGAMFTTTLSRLCQDRGLALGLGVQLRPDAGREERVSVPELAGMPVLDYKALVKSGQLLQVPDTTLTPSLEPSSAFVRKRGGLVGVKLAQAPHVIIGPRFCAYSSTAFVVPHPKIAISDPTGGSSDLLRALSLYLASSVAQYVLFFLSVRWGVDRRDLVLEDVLDLPCPGFDNAMVSSFASYHRKLTESNELEVDRSLIDAIDDVVGPYLGVPDHIQVMAREFRRLKMPMDKGGIPSAALARISHQN